MTRASGLEVQLVGSWVLFWWPEHGWQMGKVRQVGSSGSLTRGFSHVVTYSHKSSAVSTKGLVLVESLLDAASHGKRWVQLKRLP